MYCQKYKHILVDVKRIEVPNYQLSDAWAMHSSKGFNVRRMLVYWVVKCLKKSESVQNLHPSCKFQVIKQELLAFEYYPIEKISKEKIGLKEERFHVYVSRAVKPGKRKCLRPLKKFLLNYVMIQKCLERSTRILNNLKSHENRFDFLTWKVSQSIHRSPSRIIV